MPKISQKSTAKFSFRCYDPAGGNGGIHEWYDGLPVEVQAETDAVLETLFNTRRPWPDALYAELRGGCHPLCEVKITVSRQHGDQEVEDHYRILAWQGPGRNEVTLLLGFKKENNDYATHCHTALRRRDGVRKNGQKAPACAFP